LGLLASIFDNREDRTAGNGQGPEKVERYDAREPVGEGGDVTATVATSAAADEDEFDVSDLLEPVDDVDAVGDLDASEYLIIDDEEDAEPSTGVALWGEAAGGAASITGRGVPPEPGSVLHLRGEGAQRAWPGPVWSAWAIEVQRAAALLEGAAVGQRNPAGAALLSRLSRLVESGSREELLRVVCEVPLASLRQLFASLDGLKSPPIARARELVAVAAAYAAARQPWLPEVGQGTPLRQALNDLEHIDRGLQARDPEQPPALDAARERWRGAVMAVSLSLSDPGGHGLVQGASGSATRGLTSVLHETANSDPETGKVLGEMKMIKQTLLEAGTEFKGTIRSSCPVFVNGTLDGEVDAPLVSIAQSGTVSGVIKTKTLRSHGTLSGSVDGGDVFVSGAVRSHTVIRARRLEVKVGSRDGQLEVTFGKCDLDVSDAEPDTSLAAITSTSS
jgi:cytoskeletal protein CcmA (bactofilin family)